MTGKELDRSVWQQLRTLSAENAEGVAAHLAAAAILLEDDEDRALEHAEHAARRAGRVPAVREALGLVRYRRGEFTDALREFKTARRLSGSDHLLPYMVDCERGLGRYDRALDLAASPEAKRLAQDDAIELAIVVSGVRRDMGQPDAALIGLRIPALEKAGRQPWASRLLYAYAEALLATGDESAAREYFARSASADEDGLTDAYERVAELDGVDMLDLLGDEEDVDDLLTPERPGGPVDLDDDELDGQVMGDDTYEDEPEESDGAEDDAYEKDDAYAEQADDDVDAEESDDDATDEADRDGDPS